MRLHLQTTTGSSTSLLFTPHRSRLLVPRLHALAFWFSIPTLSPPHSWSTGDRRACKAPPRSANAGAANFRDSTPRPLLIAHTTHSLLPLPSHTRKPHILSALPRSRALRYHHATAPPPRSATASVVSLETAPLSLPPSRQKRKLNTSCQPTRTSRTGSCVAASQM